MIRCKHAELLIGFTTRGTFQKYVACLCLTQKKTMNAENILPVIRLILHVVYLSSGVASYGAVGHMPSRLPTISFLVHFGVNLTANYPKLSKYCVVCVIRWCRCQQLTALSISTAALLLTKLLVVEQLLHPGIVSAP